MNDELDNDPDISDINLVITKLVNNVKNVLNRLDLLNCTYQLNMTISRRTSDTVAGPGYDLWCTDRINHIHTLG